MSSVFYAGQVSNKTIMIELSTKLTTLGELNGQQEERVLCSLYIVFLYKERIQIFSIFVKFKLRNDKVPCYVIFLQRILIVQKAYF
jgi:hypothetical protein